MLETESNALPEAEKKPLLPETVLMEEETIPIPEVTVETENEPDRFFAALQQTEVTEKIITSRQVVRTQFGKVHEKTVKYDEPSLKDSVKVEEEVVVEPSEEMVVEVEPHGLMEVEPQGLMEAEFTPRKRERIPVTRTALRHGDEAASQRQVIRIRETETEKLPVNEVSTTEELIVAPVVVADVESLPQVDFDALIDTKQDDRRKEGNIARTVHRLEEIPVTRRQVVRSSVRETYTTTARVDDSEENESTVTHTIPEVTQQMPEAMEVGSKVDGNSAQPVIKREHATRTAVRMGEDIVTKRQVFRSYETETHKIMEFDRPKSEDKNREEVQEEALPEPVASVDVEVQPELYFEGETVLDIKDRGLTRTVVRHGEDEVSRRQVLRSHITETHAIRVGYEDYSEDTVEEVIAEPEEAIVDHAEVLVNGLEDEMEDQYDVYDRELIVEKGSMTGKFDFLRTALRQEEFEVTRRQVYRSTVTEVVDLDEEKRLNLINEEVSKATGKEDSGQG